MNPMHLHINLIIIVYYIIVLDMCMWVRAGLWSSLYSSVFHSHLGEYTCCSMVKKNENGRAQGPSPVNGGLGGRRSPARFLEKNSDGGMTGGTKEATGRKSPASLVSPRAGNANADGGGDDRKGSSSQELDKERGVSTTSDVDTPKVRCCDPAACKLD